MEWVHREEHRVVLDHFLILYCGYRYVFFKTIFHFYKWLSFKSKLNNKIQYPNIAYGLITSHRKTYSAKNAGNLTLVFVYIFTTLQFLPKMPDIEDPKLVRFLAEYENQSEKFLLPKKEFIKQYYGVYTSRLAKVSDSVTSTAIEKWGSEVPLKKLADLREEDSDKCILVGTLYKQQKLKPSILREISDENHVPPQPTTVYHDESDRVILEDGLNRIALTGKIEAGKTVTGVVCALLGECE